MQLSKIRRAGSVNIAGPERDVGQIIVLIVSIEQFERDLKG